MEVNALDLELTQLKLETKVGVPHPFGSVDDGLAGWHAKSAHDLELRTVGAQPEDRRAFAALRVTANRHRPVAGKIDEASARLALVFPSCAVADLPDILRLAKAVFRFRGRRTEPDFWIIGAVLVKEDCCTQEGDCKHCQHQSVQNHLLNQQELLPAWP